MQRSTTPPRTHQGSQHPPRARFVTNGEKLGGGAYGSVFLGMGEKGEQVAIKAIAQRRMKQSALEREAEILQRLSDDGHSTAVKFHGYLRPNSTQLASTASGLSELKDPSGFTVGINDCHCLVMEAIHGVELFSHVVDNGNLSEAEAAPLMGQLIEGTLRAHVHGIAHRDIKLENVIYVAPTRPSTHASVKLIDWGLAHVHRVNADGSVVRERLATRCGSRSYMAPEVVACKHSGVGYDGFAADVWSLGISLFAMLLGFFPLESADPEVDWRAREVLEAQRAGRSTIETIFSFYPSRQLSVSDEVKHLLDSMLRFTPRERCSLDSALRCALLQRYVVPVAKPPCWLPPLTAMPRVQQKPAAPAKESAN